MNLNKLFELIAKYKIYYSNAGLYMSIVNFILILATFKINYKINISLFLLAPIGFIVMFTIGYIDYKLVSAHQLKYINSRNDIKHQLDRIEKILKNQKIYK